MTENSAVISEEERPLFDYLNSRPLIDWQECQPAVPETASNPAPDGRTARPYDVEQSPDQAWRRYLENQGISAAIIALDMPAPIDRRHAYLVGFDRIRPDQASIAHVLAGADAAWSQLGDEPNAKLSGLALDRGVDRSTASVPGLAQIAADDPFAGLGPALVLQASIRGVGVHAIFFRPAAAQTAPDHQQVIELLPLLVDHGLAQADLLRQSRQTASLTAIFDRVSLPMLLLDAACRPVFENAAARRMLLQRDWLMRSPQRMIGCDSAKTTRALRAAVRRIATAPGETTDEFVRIEAPSGEWRLLQITSASNGHDGIMPDRALAIVLSPAGVAAPPPMLQALGLIPSEQRFLCRFLDSSNIGDAAQTCGISEETARTYLKRVRSKLGVSRQMELASLISSLAMPLADPVLVDRA
jgi:DNA-binding CsgD family transcriptional regulator